MLTRAEADSYHATIAALDAMRARLRLEMAALDTMGDRLPLDIGKELYSAAKDVEIAVDQISIAIREIRLPLDEADNAARLREERSARYCGV